MPASLPEIPFTNELLDRIAFPVAHMFVNGMKVSDIQETLRRRYGIFIKREKFYGRILKHAHMLGYFWTSPPREKFLAQNLHDLHPDAGEIEVVRDTFGLTTYHLATAAAEITYGLVKTFQKQDKNRPVRLALGVGRVSRDFAHALAALHRSDHHAPDLVIHALTTGFNEFGPEEVPGGFPTLFSQGFARIRFVPLETSSFLRAEKLRRTVGDEQREDVQIVITSIAAFADSHGGLRSILARNDGRVQQLTDRNCLGEAQLRPYDENGPMDLGDDRWPATLFELEDLVRFAARDDKHVVLVGGPCAHCARPKLEALRPLLARPELRIWNHLVLDEATARALVDDAGGLCVPTGQHRSPPALRHLYSEGSESESA